MFHFEINYPSPNYKNYIEEDISSIFNELCKEFEVDSQIKILFNNLFKEF